MPDRLPLGTRILRTLRVREQRTPERDAVLLPAIAAEDLPLIARVLEVTGHELVAVGDAIPDRIDYYARPWSRAANPGAGTAPPSRTPPAVDDDAPQAGDAQSAGGHEFEGAVWCFRGSVSVGRSAWWAGSLSIAIDPAPASATAAMLHLRRYGPMPDGYAGVQEFDLSFAVDELEAALTLLTMLTRPARERGLVPAPNDPG